MVLYKMFHKIWRPVLLSVSIFAYSPVWASTDIYTLCRKLSESRRFGELVSVTDSLLSENISQEQRNWLYLQSAQGYVMLDSLKKGKAFIVRISPEDFTNPDHKTMYYNIAGILALKSEMDFSHALYYLRKAAALAEESGNMVNMCSAYCNIAELYSLRNDTLGLDYALRAHNLAVKIKDTVASCYTAIQVGNMYLMAGHKDEALAFAKNAASVISGEETRGYAGYTDLLTGKIYYAMGDYNTAEIYYRKLLEDSLSFEPSLAMSVYYCYGILESACGKYTDAEKFFLKSAEYSHKTGNIEGLSDIMKELAILYKATGDSAKALENYASLLNLTDSLSLVQKERDFSRLLIGYEKEEHAAEMQRKELDLQKHRIRLLFMLILFLCVSFITIYIFLAYRKKNEMYARLAEQYRRLNSRLKNLEDSLIKESSEVKDVELWKKIESTMSGDSPFYRQNDVSLEKLAEKLATNRTYVSRVINKYAGVSFSSYINLKRIEEATKRLEDPEDNVSVKSLAYELGYGSPSSFIHKFSKEIGCPPAKYRELRNCLNI